MTDNDRERIETIVKEIADLEEKMEKLKPESQKWDDLANLVLEKKDYILEILL